VFVFIFIFYESSVESNNNVDMFNTMVGQKGQTK